jgi:hypothetical protein
MGSQHVNAPQFVNFVTGAFGCGTIFGFPAGFISGVLGGSLGGPIGYCVGGFAGTTAVMLAGFGPYVGPVGIYPAVWGAAFGLVLGLHLYRQVPVLPGVSWLSRVIFGSPLGGRHGWRQR